MEFYCTAAQGSWAQICKRLRIPGIDSKGFIPPGWESIPGLSLKGLQIGSLSSCWCLLKQVGAVLVILPCRQRIIEKCHAFNQSWASTMEKVRDNRHRRSTSNTRQLKPDNYQPTTTNTTPENQQAALDNQHSTTNKNKLPSTETTIKQNKHLIKRKG